MAGKVNYRLIAAFLCAGRNSSLHICFIGHCTFNPVYANAPIGMVIYNSISEPHNGFPLSLIADYKFPHSGDVS